jgi:ABC-type hemin transport system ATPase subunit
MLRVDIQKQLGEFSLAAAFASEGRVTGLFGASGSGKTSLINAILYGADMNNKGLEHPNKVVSALVPNRELKEDLCQAVINAGVFDDTEVLWLGRPPLGRGDGRLDERLADSMRELQRDTWQKLDSLKAQLKLVLEEV